MVAVSVIMPVYNSSSFLNSSIESIQKQTLKDIEIICVDDGSTDDSLNVLHDLNEKYGNIKIISQQNSGPGVARNTGIKNATGDYIAFLDSDDIYLDDTALEKMYNLGKSHDYNLICANLKRINQDYSIDINYDFVNSRFTYFYKENVLKSEDYGIPFAFYRNLFKRSLLEENWIDFPDLRFGEDPVFMVNVLINIDEFLALPIDFYGYNHSVGGGVNEKITTFGKKYAYIKHFKDIFDILIDNNLDSILTIYKIEFIDYLVYSDNIHDDEIKMIIRELFKNYNDYFNEKEYGFFIIDYIINENQFNRNSFENNPDLNFFGDQLNEYLEIKKFLFEETSVDVNFIDTSRLNDYLNYISKKDYKNFNLPLKEISFNELIKINKYIFENNEYLEKETERIDNEINAPYFNENAEFLRKYVESRIDIKNFGNETNDICILESNDSNLNIVHPSWFNDEEGIGTIVNSVKGDLDLSFKCINDGKLSILFKAIDYRDKNENRIPIYIDYTEIIINDEVIVDGSHVSWHDNPLIFEKEVKNEDIINIKVKWEPVNHKSNIFLPTDYDKMIDNFYEARIDIKNNGKKDNSIILVDCDDYSSNIYKPVWLKDEYGVGTVVFSRKCNMNLSFKCINDGELEINFRANDFFDKNNKIPIFIDYSKIRVNGKDLIEDNFVSWCNKPFVYKHKVKNNQIINIELEWKPLGPESNMHLLQDNNYDDLNIYSQARFDIKNYGDANNNIVLLNSNTSFFNMSQPEWFSDSNGIGYMITSLNKELDLSFKCVNEGELKIEFRGIDYRDRNNNRIPIYIDYKKIEIDGKSIIDGSTVLWHDNGLSYDKEVKNGQIVNIKLEWGPLNENSNCQNLFFDSKDEEIEKLKCELEELINENNELKKFKGELLDSNSWKMMASLRKIRN